MNRVSIFLFNHSQKVAAGLALVSMGASYLLQSHLEVITRWAVLKHDGLNEIKPSERINRLLNEVCTHFTLTDVQRCQVDCFLTAVDQSCTIGSITSPGYAFIGLPDFASFTDSSEIVIDNDSFYTPYFRYGPYSPIGKKRTELMIIPEPALRFLIARELVRLGAHPANGNGSCRSVRTNSFCVRTGMTIGAYIAYQVCYTLNRRFHCYANWPTPSRMLLYTGVALIALFGQWQLASASQRLHCLTVDRTVAQIDPSFIQGGILYYDWRLRWNRFWYDRLVEWHAVRKSGASFDPVKQFQDEQRETLTSSGEPVTDPVTGYYVPQIVTPDASETSARSLNPEAYKARFTYSIHPRITASGNERWAADGDAINFGLTGILASGFLPTLVARFFSLFSAPATSQTRLKLLQQMAAEAQSSTTTSPLPI